MDSNISIRAMLARLVPVAVIAGLLMLGATAMAKQTAHWRTASVGGSPCRLDGYAGPVK